MPSKNRKWIPAAVRKAKYARAKACARCRQPLSKVRNKGPKSPTLDHIVPLSKGGSNAPRNLRVVHKLCNERKYAKK